MMSISRVGIVFCLCTALASCTFVRTVGYNFAGINDYKKFPANTIQNAGTPFQFTDVTQDWKTLHPSKYKVSDSKRMSLDDFLPDSKTVAFLVIRNDSILYQNYFHKYDENSVVASFSMAKSFVSALIGCAIADGKITSVEDSMTHYMTELRGKGLGSIRIRHLLQMTSGLHSVEGYANPFSDVARMYYGKNIRKFITRSRKEDPPGMAFEYISANSQILGMIVERATGQSLAAYLEQKIWMHTGMEHPATWSLDSKNSGMEKAFCCINSTARDFARFGRLYLNKGNWNGKQLIPESWVQSSTRIEAKEGSSRNYQYQWWIPSSKGDFCARGILGQYIYVNPASGHIIVRLGKSEGNINWIRIFREIAGYSEEELKNK